MEGLEIAGERNLGGMRFRDWFWSASLFSSNFCPILIRRLVIVAPRILFGFFKIDCDLLSVLKSDVRLHIGDVNVYPVNVLSKTFA